MALLGEVRESYGWFGLEPRFTFATKPDKAIGDPALWERAERLTREAFAAADISYELKPKDGTFYAPKIDIYIDDALGREWQMATIQIDLTMLPERFDLTYIDEKGKPQRPIAIHRAIYGSLERFIGILIEHFAGAFPLWLAPVQAVVIPIADRHVEAGRGAGRRCCERAGCASRSTAPSNRMQYKIRTAQEQKVPYMVVLGDREIEARTASPRTRGGEQQPAEDWEPSPIASRPRSRERIGHLGGPVSQSGLARGRCRDQGRDGRPSRLGAAEPGPAPVHREGLHRSCHRVPDRPPCPACDLVDRAGDRAGSPFRSRPTSCSACRS